MCLSTVYLQTREQRQKVMQDVAKMQSSGDGYLLIGLLGDQKTVAGRIAQIDFVDEHSVIIEIET
ncbi:MAG: CooT family nickel-binding protein [Desulfobacterales bacterium]|jgi:predicted RNA-binding protein